MRAGLLEDCHLLFCQEIGGPAAARLIRHQIHPMKAPPGTTIQAQCDAVSAMLAGRLPPWLAKRLNRITLWRNVFLIVVLCLLPADPAGLFAPAGNILSARQAPQDRDKSNSGVGRIRKIGENAGAHQTGRRTAARGRSRQGCRVRPFRQMKPEWSGPRSGNFQRHAGVMGRAKRPHAVHPQRAQ